MMSLPEGQENGKLADSFAAESPTLTRRAPRIPAIPNKAHAVTGMRRAGKSCFLKQFLADQVQAGVPRDALVYFSFEDERLAEMQAARLHWVLEECRVGGRSTLWRGPGTGKPPTFWCVLT